LDIEPLVVRDRRPTGWAVGLERNAPEVLRLNIDDQREPIDGSPRIDFPRFVYGLNKIDPE
jgi:hypothetical protein